MSDNQNVYHEAGATMRSTQDNDQVLRTYTSSYSDPSPIYRDGPAFEILDIVAVGFAATMMLGPLLASAVGFGPS